MSDDEVLNSVLVVDDDESFRLTLVRAFERRGWDVRHAENATEALRLASEESPEHAVVDLRMPGEDGLSLVKSLLAIDPATKIVVLTGFGSIATAIEAIRAGARHYLTKPADVTDVIAAFDQREGQAPPPLTVPSLERVEWEHIQRVLHSVGGNVTLAAKLLGIHRRSLQRKLNRHPRPR